METKAQSNISTHKYFIEAIQRFSSLIVLPQLKCNLICQRDRCTYHSQSQKSRLNFHRIASFIF